MSYWRNPKVESRTHCWDIVDGDECIFRLNYSDYAENSSPRLVLEKYFNVKMAGFEEIVRAEPVKGQEQTFNVYANGEKLQCVVKVTVAVNKRYLRILSLE